MGAEKSPTWPAFSGTGNAAHNESRQQGGKQIFAGEGQQVLEILTTL